MKRIPVGYMITLLILLAVLVTGLLWFMRIDDERGTLAEGPIYISSGNILKGAFLEPFETAIIVLADGDWHSFTAQEEFSVGVGATYIREFLRLQGRAVSEIVLIIHNHFRNPHFSQGDKAECQRLVRYGFYGTFAMIHTPTRMVIKWEDGKEVEVGVLEEGDDGILGGGFTLDRFSREEGK